MSPPPFPPAIAGFNCFEATLFFFRFFSAAATARETSTSPARHLCRSCAEVILLWSQCKLSHHAASFEKDGRRTPASCRSIIMIHRSLPPIGPVPVSVLPLSAFALFSGSLPCLSLLRLLNLGVSLRGPNKHPITCRLLWGPLFSETPTWTFTISTMSTPSEARRLTKASNCSSHSNMAFHKRSPSLYPFNRSPGPSNRSC